MVVWVDPGSAKSYSSATVPSPRHCSKMFISGQLGRTIAVVWTQSLLWFLYAAQKQRPLCGRCFSRSRVTWEMATEVNIFDDCLCDIAFPCMSSFSIGSPSVPCNHQRRRGLPPLARTGSLLQTPGTGRREETGDPSPSRKSPPEDHEYRQLQYELCGRQGGRVLNAQRGMQKSDRYHATINDSVSMTSLSQTGSFQASYKVCFGSHYTALQMKTRQAVGSDNDTNLC